ncbi:MAG TPA: ATP-binding protein [Stellaceae bacterium]|nr:ATP-binding protein [Stellaceae bacterium]
MSSIERIAAARAAGDENAFFSAGTLGTGVGAAGRQSVSRRGAPASVHVDARALVFSTGAQSLLLLLAGCAAVAVSVVLGRASYQAATLRAALETMMTLFAFAAAWLLRAQFMHSRRYRDLLLALGVAALGLDNLAVNALPAVFALHADADFVAAGLCSQPLIGGIIAAAAFLPPERVLPHRRVIATAFGLISVTVLGSALVGALLADRLIGETSSEGGYSSLLSHPVGFLVVAVKAGFLIAAAVGFTRRRRAAPGGGAMLLALAAILLAAAGFCLLSLGSVPTTQVTVGDGLRALGFALLLIAAVREELRLCARLGRGAVLAERERVARDLHDGLAQDLAFIAAHVRNFAGQVHENDPVVIAAKRALAISRHAISELSNPAGATIDEALEAVAHELRGRFDIAIAVDAQPEADVGPRARGHLTRIAREAIANAARHGGARNVIVSLRRADAGVVLRVVDDGCGIRDRDGLKAPEGFGLRSMRERADALGGWLRFDGARDGGAELEVVLPCPAA